MMIPARWVLGIYLVIDNLLPFLAFGSNGSGVAHGAHIGGFLAGLGLVWVSDRGLLDFSRFKKPAAWSSEKLCTPQAIPEMIEAGELASASQCYLSLDDAAQRSAVDPMKVLCLGEFLAGKGESREALRVFRRFIVERPNSPGLDRAYLGAGQILLEQPRYVTNAYHYLLTAIELASTPLIEAQARAGIVRIEELQRRRGRSLVS